MSEFQITKKSMDYSSRKSTKLGVFLLWAHLTFKIGRLGRES